MRNLGLEFKVNNAVAYAIALVHAKPFVHCERHTPESSSAAIKAHHDYKLNRLEALRYAILGDFESAMTCLRSAAEFEITSFQIRDSCIANGTFRLESRIFQLYPGLKRAETINYTTGIGALHKPEIEVAKVV